MMILTKGTAKKQYNIERGDPKMENIALEIGQRCRRMRQAQGISQQELADKLGTTAQNISKYEKQGISNIEVIREVSAALGHDLLQDEMDTEGAVGEIGKEILSLIAPIHYEADSIIYGENLYGLSPDRAIRELLKLEKLGLCVREQYTTFYGTTEDRVFITAKGVIALKHSGAMDPAAFVNRDQIQTYERLCRGYSSIQEFIDENPVLGKTCRLYSQNGFRVNLIHYLQNKLCKGYQMQRYTLDDEYFPGKGCFYDILFSMVMKLTREKADQYIETKLSINEKEAEIERLYTQLHYNDPTEQEFISQFCQAVGANENNMNFEFEMAGSAGEGRMYVTDENADMLDEELERLETELHESTRKSIAEVYEEERENHDLSCPIDWFSIDEIRQYIESNILAPANEYEEKLNKDIMEIMTAYPQTRDYFVFPFSWEYNGLADLVREKYGVQNWKEVDR